ncbi:uncharacterized protein LY79DRAFT_324936 [Colletotrichum navitas]|uniref:Uncharacterized protein n=1 Tax=Colletotrichum navitas TaxID=681940 RepID=A0AAD8Q8H8_9PEZI|nr:uncharacterized protein LY79DRAFT_324936 [Colletotrichum navitas]KAK1597991.1 hypothetical protein LY79DRAFT_324936 [Colletotrichum navitas]
MRITRGRSRDSDTTRDSTCISAGVEARPRRSCLLVHCFPSASRRPKTPFPHVRRHASTFVWTDAVNQGTRPTQVSPTRMSFLGRATRRTALASLDARLNLKPWSQSLHAACWPRLTITSNHRRPPRQRISTALTGNDESNLSLLR